MQGRSMKVAVVDYGSGNLASAARALAAAAARVGLAAEILVTDRPADVAASDRVVLPGQGAFADCAQGLAARPGLLAALQARVAEGAPFLGICVGMQLMAERGLEHAETPGFGWIRGEIAPLPAPGLRLPQMGWNALDFVPGRHPLLEGLAPGEHVYFVHSYGLRAYDAAEVLSTTEYGGTVPAIVANANRAGTQFHVEKSQEAGLRILGNFLRWSPGGPSGGGRSGAAAP
jgi:glutamine amidotransferase